MAFKRPRPLYLQHPEQTAENEDAEPLQMAFLSAARSRRHGSLSFQIQRPLAILLIDSCRYALMRCLST